jgi:hypothetical protein
MWACFSLPIRSANVSSTTSKSSRSAKENPSRPFHPIKSSRVQTIADFEDGKHDQAFNLYMAAAEAEWFDESWIRSKPLRFEPMKLAVIDTGLDGRKSLECRGRTAEEVHCTGVRTSGAADANAIAVTLNVDAPEQRNTLVGAGPVVPLDFLVFVAPARQRFPMAISLAIRRTAGQRRPRLRLQPHPPQHLHTHRSRLRHLSNPPLSQARRVVEAGAPHRRLHLHLRPGRDA